MTDGQLIAAALTTGLPALGALIRSAAVMIRDARLETAKQWQEGNAALRDALKESNAVIRENSQAFADLRQALGTVDARTQDVGARVVEIHKETSGVYDTPPSPALAAAPVDDDLDFDRPPAEVAPIGRAPTQGDPTRRTPPGGIPRAASAPYLFTKRKGE